MSQTMVGVIGIVLMIILLFSRIWVGLSMMIIGFLGCWYLIGFDRAVSILGLVPYTQSTNYIMTCMPMFVFMGVILSVSGLGEDLYSCTSKWLGSIKGGLSMATSVACGFFAAVCGDSVVTAVTMGKVAYPSMKKHGYPDTVIAGCICAGGTIGVLIPPSIPFIIYGLITETSIGKLFLAGIVPGILQVLSYIITIYIMGKVKPGFFPNIQKYSLKEKLYSSKTIWPVLVIFIVIMGGIYGGYFTPTEAGAFGAFSSIIISIFNRRLTISKFKEALFEAIINTAMVLFLLVGAYIFLRFMALSKLPENLSIFITTLNTTYGVRRGWILFAILLMYIFLGMFMDVVACVFLTLGVIYPVIDSLGFNMIWFGVIMVRVMEIGMISPPFGMNLFTVSKATGLKLKEVYEGILPFLLADICHLALLIYVPGISLLFE